MLLMGRPKSQTGHSLLGMEIRRRREALGLSQEEFGALIGPDGLSRKSVGKIERGETHQPSDDVLDALEKHLSISRQLAFELMQKIPGINYDDLNAVVDRAAVETDPAVILRLWRAQSEKTQLGIQKMMAASLFAKNEPERAEDER